MTSYKPLNSRGSNLDQPPSPTEKLDDNVSGAAVTASGALGAFRVAAAVLLGLFVWPPLAVIVFTIVVPFLVVALILGLLVGILSTPYLLFHHFRGHHRGHLSLLAHRLRLAARALINLAPHRIVADVRKIGASR